MAPSGPKAFEKMVRLCHKQVTKNGRNAKREEMYFKIIVFILQGTSTRFEQDFEILRALKQVNATMKES